MANDIKYADEALPYCANADAYPEVVRAFDRDLFAHGYYPVIGQPFGIHMGVKRTIEQWGMVQVLGLYQMIGQQVGGLTHCTSPMISIAKPLDEKWGEFKDLHIGIAEYHYMTGLMEMKSHTIPFALGHHKFDFNGDKGVAVEDGMLHFPSGDPMLMQAIQKAVEAGCRQELFIDTTALKFRKNDAVLAFYVSPGSGAALVERFDMQGDKAVSMGSLPVENFVRSGMQARRPDFDPWFVP